MSDYHGGGNGIDAACHKRGGSCGCGGGVCGKYDRRSTPAGEVQMPPLPEPEVVYDDGNDEWGYVTYGKAFTADQMRQYARDAIAADRRARGRQ